MKVVGTALPGAQYQHGAAVRTVMLQIGDGGLETAAVRGELPGVHGEQPSGLQGMAGGGERVRHDDGKFLQGGIQLFPGQQQLSIVARQQARLQKGFRVLLVLEQGTFHPLVHPTTLAEEHHRVTGQVVDACRNAWINSRQIAVHSAGNGAVFQLFAVLP